MFLCLFFLSAFDFLMKNLDDLVLDTPDAPTILGNFMARAIADDCIPPKFILSYKGHVDTELAGKSLCRAGNFFPPNKTSSNSIVFCQFFHEIVFIFQFQTHCWALSMAWWGWTMFGVLGEVSGRLSTWLNRLFSCSRSTSVLETLGKPPDASENWRCPTFIMNWCMR